MSIRIAALAKKAGLGPGYSGHGCQIGIAQDLAAEGYNLAQLMTAGRWTNPAMPTRYTRNQAAARSAIAQYYRQLSLFNQDAPANERGTKQPLFTDDPIPVQPTTSSPKPASEQRYAG